MLYVNNTKEVLSIFIASSAGENPPPAGGYEFCNPMREIKHANIVKDMGIFGDRWFGVKQFRFNDGKLKNFSHKRDVSLFRIEDLIELKKYFPEIDAINLRRNILVKGINLKEINQIKIKNVVLEFSGNCHSCSHIEKVNNLPGLSKVLYDIGGIRMKVINGGVIKKGDKIELI